MDFKNFRFSTSDQLPDWSLFFLELGFYASKYASGNNSRERLTITLTVPGAEYASALIAIGANVQAITSDEEILDHGSSSGLIDIKNLSYNNEVMMRFTRVEKTKRGFKKQKLTNSEGVKGYTFSESSKPADDNKFQFIPEKDILRLVFPKGTSPDLIDLSPLLKVCCKDISFASMLEKKECVTTLLGIKSHAFDESSENLFYMENELLIGGYFNDISRFQDGSKEANGYYSRVYSDFSSQTLAVFQTEMHKNKSRILVLSAKAINSLSLGQKTGERVRINLLDRSKNIISLQDGLAKINQERSALGGQHLDPSEQLKVIIPNSIEIAIHTVKIK